MFEIQGQSSLHKSGTVDVHTDFYRQRRPAWLVLLKLLGVIGMAAVWYAIALPSLLEGNFVLWQAIAIATGVMIVYTVIAFFFRPEPNTDNVGSGMDRLLWRLSCCLGPGRFASETMLDLCVLFGLLQGGEQTEAAPALAVQSGASFAAPPGSFDPTRPIAPLDPNRFAQTSANFVAGQIQLDTQRFRKPVGEGQPVKV